MVITYNGMPAGELGDVRWRKSRHSNPNGACVELAALPSGEIAMRNSRFPVGPDRETRVPHGDLTAGQRGQFHARAVGVAVVALSPADVSELSRGHAIVRNDHFRSLSARLNRGEAR